MMYVKFINNTPHLYNEDTDLGEMIRKVDKKSKTGDCYKLPENPLGRQWIKGNLCYDGYEIGKVEGKHGYNWQRYLTDEDSQLLKELMAKAEARRQEAKKAMTPEEKLEAQIAKLNAQLAKLRGNN